MSLHLLGTSPCRDTGESPAGDLREVSSPILSGTKEAEPGKHSALTNSAS